MAPSGTTRSDSPLEWTPDDVVAFLTDPKAVGLPQSAAAAFSANQIDGPALLELTTDEVRSELGLVLGHRKTLFRAINRLKVASKAAATKPKHAKKHSAPASPPPGTTVSSVTGKSTNSPASPETSAPVPATSATPGSGDADATAGLTCAGCGRTKGAHLFSSRQRKIAAHRPARCIECAQSAAGTSPRAAPTELQPYLARKLRPAEAAGYKASGVLPMRRAQDGTLEVLLALERRQDWAIRGRGDKRTANAKDDTGDSKSPRPASGRVEGTFLHPIGGTREADDKDAIATAGREFAEEVGHVLLTHDSQSGVPAQETIEVLRGARGRYVLWQPRGKYALWVYLLPAEQAKVAETFAAWKAEQMKETPSASAAAGEEKMLGVRWVPVSMDGTVQIGHNAQLDGREGDGLATNDTLATSFCMELLQRKALRQHLAQTTRRHVRLQLSVSSSPATGPSRAVTSSPLAQSPMLTVAAEALLSKRLAAATPSPVQKKHQQGKKRKTVSPTSESDAPNQSKAKRQKDTPGDVQYTPGVDAIDAGDSAAGKQATKKAKKKRKKLKAKGKVGLEQQENDQGERSKSGSEPTNRDSEAPQDEPPTGKKSDDNAEQSERENNSNKGIEIAQSQADNNAVKRPKIDAPGESKADPKAVDADNVQEGETAVAAVKQIEVDSKESQLFVVDRSGANAEDEVSTGNDVGRAAAAAPKKLNRAERKRQRKLAHAAKMKVKAAAALHDSAALLLLSEAGTHETVAEASSSAPERAALSPAPVPAPIADANSSAELAPNPSPRTLGKFRFTGMGLQIG